MTAEFSHALPRWSIGVPIAAVVALAIVWNRPLEWTLIAVVALALIAAVLAAVHHAEDRQLTVSGRTIGSSRSHARRHSVAPSANASNTGCDTKPICGVSTTFCNDRSG